ncbi:MAG: cation:proton antiporter [Proteobacteria bacterium]|nr:cation:proton antiporter [Pseudomonadota bacterium]MBU4296122.1 cation:proton antiporter [Pseudomonadota bacterium]MCG2746729.1 cation:proton antiporter [Desulfobulbaceae bacterium]
MAHTFWHPLLALGLILTAGYCGGKAAHFFRLPKVTGYILAGLALSPSLSGIIHPDQIDVLFGFTSDMALAIIAYSIGGSLQMSRIRDLGREILWINLTEGTGAFICTYLAVYAAGHLLPLPDCLSGDMLTCVSLILAGISVATAPAATLAVLHELRARGPLTTTLLGVVALDDALSIILFTAALTLAAQISGSGTGNASAFVQGLFVILGALAIGLAGGFIFSIFLDTARRPESNLLLTLAAVFLVAGLSATLSFSPLLANMMMGFTITNRVKHADNLFHQLDLVEETVFCLFFCLAAAHFDINALKTSALLGLVLLVGRFLGKLAGTYIGGRISHAPPQVYRYLGLTLMPQAGLSLGLIFLAGPVLPAEVFELLLSAMLASIIMNEIISPPLVKWAVTKVGESFPDR